MTTVGDCSFSGAAATACSELGLRATIYLEVFGATDAPIGERFEPMRDAHRGSLSEDVRIGISPHAPYTCTIDLYGACVELGLPVSTHLAESDDETEFLRTGGGRLAVVRRAARASARDDGHPRPRRGGSPRLERPRRTLRESGRGGDRTPGRARRRSRALPALERDPRLRSRAPDALREAGLRVCIATDSPASTPSFDMFDELRAAIVAARAREGRPDALTAADALELATLGGARALGLDDTIGSLVPGKQADLTVLSLAGTPFVPWEDPVTGAVLGGSPHGVLATLVSGKPRYEKGGKTWLELIDAARSARGRLLQSAEPTS